LIIWIHVATIDIIASSSTDDEICGRDMELIELHKKKSTSGENATPRLCTEKKPQPNHPATIIWGGTVSFPWDLNTDWLVPQLGDQPPHSQ
jgi:hypothetical protein